MGERGPAIKTRQCQIDQKILGSFGRDLGPGLCARCTLDYAESPLEAAKSGNNGCGFRKFVEIGQTAARRKEIHQRLKQRFINLEPVD
jgi:hypothetical protein